MVNGNKEVKMNIAKCCNCGKVLPEDAIIYQIHIIDGNGQSMWEPACSCVCAFEEQEKFVNLHYRRYKEVKNQSFQKMNLKDFGK